MSAMKISLDAAMRARDVSSSWRDDTPSERDEPGGTAIVRRIDSATPAVAAEVAEPVRAESAVAGQSVSAAPPANGGDQRRANGPRRRRRTRLRHGRPT